MPNHGTEITGNTSNAQAYNQRESTSKADHLHRENISPALPSRPTIPETPPLVLRYERRTTAGKNTTFRVTEAITRVFH